MKAIAEGSFPELKTITNVMDFCDTDTFNWQIFLSQLLVNKGNQLTFIEIATHYPKSVDVVWKALKHCKAAKVIKCLHIFVDSRSTVTYEDVRAICHLPNLQLFTFKIGFQKRWRKPWYMPWRKQKRGDLLHEKVERAVKEHTDFQFQCDSIKQMYSLYRPHF